METEAICRGAQEKKGHYPLSDLSPCCLSTTLVSKHVLCHMMGLLMLGMPGLPLGLKGEDVAWEFAFLASFQRMLMLLV